jgi:hypothetical protein
MTDRPQKGSRLGDGMQQLAVSSWLCCRRMRVVARQRWPPAVCGVAYSGADGAALRSSRASSVV